MNIFKLKGLKWFWDKVTGLKRQTSRTKMTFGQSQVYIGFKGLFSHLKFTNKQLLQWLSWTNKKLPCQIKGKLNSKLADTTNGTPNSLSLSLSQPFSHLSLKLIILVW